MHPILIEFPNGFFIASYGAMIALGLLAAMAAGAIRGKPHGLGFDQIADLGISAIVGGLIGGRLLYIIQNFGEFVQDPVGIIFSRTGFVFLGGLLGGVAGCLWYIRRKRLDIWAVAEIAAVSVPVGHALGRIGCHLAGCCYGGLCQISSLAIRVPAHRTPTGEPIPSAYWDQLESGLVQPPELWSQPVWPVQLMEASGLALIAAALWAWSATGRRPIGITFGFYLIAYAFLRFGLEYLRGDVARGLYFGGLVSLSQMLSLPVLVAGIAVVAMRWGKVPPASPAVPESDAGSKPKPRRRADSA